MKSHPASASPATAARSSAAPPVVERPVVKMLSGAAFLLLAVALCSRALLDEDRTVAVTQLVTPPEVRLSASLMVRHVVHLLAACGIGLGALWIVLSRRTWRVGGLEAGALVLVGAAMLSVPIASDKRLAINTALDTLLPLLAAGALYQLLADRPAWRRALLAGVVAGAAANCFKATAQAGWEYKQGWEDYQQNKVKFWSMRGVGLNDPAVAAFEESRKLARPRGFIQGTNVLSSFLLLGLAATGAAVAGRNWPRSRGQRIAAAGLVLLAAWLLVMLLGIHTAGAIVGLLAAIATAVVGVLLRDRPKRLAILLAGVLVLLQASLVALAMAPSGLHQAFLSYRGAGEKVRTLGARLCYWEGALRLFTDSPLTGVGPSQFRKHYLAVRPAYSDESAVDVHSWLLNMATEWGVLGVLGVLVAVGGSGWFILRAMAGPPDETGPPATGALLPAMLVVPGSWLLVAFDLPASQWGRVLACPMAISLAAGALVGLCRLSSRTGQVILLAGLVGLLVHSTAETTGSVPGVMWPFWAIVALAMAWDGRSASTVPTPLQRRLARATPIVAGAAVVAAVALTAAPLHAVMLMHQAQRAAVENQPKLAVALLRSAGDADPLDPLPLKTAAFLAYRLAQTDPARALEHFRDYVALSSAAVQRNPADYSYWRTLGLANMYLATATSDFALVDEAIRDIRRALELNPQWPVGWFELARMAAVEGGPQGDRVALLQTALDATNKALSLEDSRGDEVSPTLTSQDRAELLRMREQLSRRLKAVAARPAATQMAR